MKVKLDKVCKRIYAGGDVPKDRYSTVKTAEYAIPIYANAEKDNGLYGYTDTARENELSITVAARGTIGFTAIRREPFLPVVRLITVVPDLSTVSERYLYYALRNCKPASSGTSIPQLTVPDIKKNEIELYSLSVQETIADKLDAVGRVIELLQQQLQKLDELVKARFIELFGSPVSNPFSWEKKTLKDICIKLNDGTHFSPESFKTGEYKYVTAKNIRLSGFDFSNITYVPEEVHRPIFERCNPELGDVLYIKDGATTGIAMVNTLEEEFTLLSSVALLKQDRSIINGYFLAALLNNEDMYLDIRNNMGGAAITRLTIAKLNVIKVIVPPIAIQEQFAKFVKQTDKSKVVVQKALDEAQLLFDSLMQKYFG